MQGRRIAMLENRVGEHLAGLIAKQRATPLWGNPPNEGPLDPRTIKAAEEAAAAEKARKDAERKAADAARRQELEQQAPPPATPQ